MQVDAGPLLDARTREGVSAELAGALAAHRNPGGGWGHYAGKASRLEPTCWVFLALRDRLDPIPAEHRLFFERCRRPDGLFADSGAPPNYAHNALTLVTALERPALFDRTTVPTLSHSILTTGGLRTGPSPAVRQDNSLSGWPWFAGTFSWVEPTSWCLFALKRCTGGLSSAGVDHRIAEGERLLLDRACEGGGWNYGNANVLGARLAAYVPTTALALMALQDRRNAPAVEQSLQFLERRATEEQSGLAFSLALICLRIYQRSVADVEAALVAQWRRTGFLGNVTTTAMALCALNAEDGGLDPFRLERLAAPTRS